MTQACDDSKRVQVCRHRGGFSCPFALAWRSWRWPSPCGLGVGLGDCAVPDLLGASGSAFSPLCSKWHQDGLRHRHHDGQGTTNRSAHKHLAPPICDLDPRSCNRASSKDSHQFPCWPAQKVQNLHGMGRDEPTRCIPIFGCVFHFLVLGSRRRYGRV